MSETLALHAGLVSVALTLALLHVLFYAFALRRRLYLYFAIQAAAFAAVAWVDLEGRLGSPLLLPVVGGDLQRFTVSALILATARFVYALFSPRAPRRFWFYLAAISALLAIGIVAPRAFGRPAWLLGLAVIGDTMLTTVRHWRRLEEGAWIVALGMALFGLGGGTQITLDILGLSTRGAPYLWGGLAMLLATSVYLAHSFARTRLELERRLVEVETLSRQRLEQERAAREEEVRRRVLEADHRRKTEELEAARELQLGLLPAEVPRLPGVRGRGMDAHGDRGRRRLLRLRGRPPAGGADGGDRRRSRPRRARRHPGGRGQGAVPDGGGTRPAGAHARALHRRGARHGAAALPRRLAVARFRPDAIEVASAGMPPPLVRRAGGEVEEVELGGVPLGGLQTAYEARRIALEPGDLVLLYSDGLPELPDTEGDPLGYPGVRDRLAEVAGVTAEEVVAALAAAVEARTGGAPPPDDVTLVAVRRAPAPTR